jgi:hypothetical protein
MVLVLHSLHMSVPHSLMRQVAVVMAVGPFVPLHVRILLWELIK